MPVIAASAPADVRFPQEPAPFVPRLITHLVWEPKKLQEELQRGAALTGQHAAPRRPGKPTDKGPV